MPTAVPTMPHSLSGVSKQRCSPNCSCRPIVAPNTPPFLPTSSPNTTTRSSFCISVRSASVIASSIVITFWPGRLSPALVSVAVMEFSSARGALLAAALQREVADVGADAALLHQFAQLLPLLRELRRQVHVDIVEQRVGR